MKVHGEPIVLIHEFTFKQTELDFFLLQNIEAVVFCYKYLMISILKI